MSNACCVFMRLSKCSSVNEHFKMTREQTMYFNTCFTKIIMHEVDEEMN